MLFYCVRVDGYMYVFADWRSSAIKLYKCAWVQ